MRIWAWTTSWWNDADEAVKQGAGPVGLVAWYEHMLRFLSPTHCYVACGTWSDPAQSPLPSSVAVINAGIPQGTPYDMYYRHLWWAAASAGAAYALNHSDKWDLLAFLDADALVGAVDFDGLVREFLRRDEMLLAEWWCGTIGGPFYIWKPAGVVRLLHCRQRANILPVLNKPSADKPLTGEAEMLAIFKDSWWNPWPHLDVLRQDYGKANPVSDREVFKWPFVVTPNPAIVSEYERTQTARAKPVA